MSDRDEARRVLTTLPVFNEAAHISEVLDAVRRYSDDILVVDDGSTDATPEILSHQSDIRVIEHEENQGYGAALRTAFEFAAHEGYSALVTIDCDGQHEPRLIPELAARLYPADGSKIDIVSGSRYLRHFPGDSTPPAERQKINIAITELVNERLDLNLTDTFCGFKAYRVDSLAKLNVTELGYAMPLQVWVQAAVAGLSIVEYAVPLVYLEEERSFGGSLDDGRRRLAYYQEVLSRELAETPLGCTQK